MIQARGNRKRFSREEAEVWLGRRVCSVVAFTDVPRGTGGRVTRIEEVEPGGFELGVEWDVPVRGRTQLDWFTKEEFDCSLVGE